MMIYFATTEISPTFLWCSVLRLFIACAVGVREGAYNLFLSPRTLCLKLHECSSNTCCADLTLATEYECDFNVSVHAHNRNISTSKGIAHAQNRSISKR